MGSSRYLLLALPLMTSALWAETGLSELSAAEFAAEVPMVLTPARLSQPQAEVPASVTIIERELIEASGAREIYQVLQLVPGMAALDVDGNKPTVSYHPTQARDIRRMLVLVDGRSMYQPGLARVRRQVAERERHPGAGDLHHAAVVGRRHEEDLPSAQPRTSSDNGCGPPCRRRSGPPGARA